MAGNQPSDIHNRPTAETVQAIDSQPSASPVFALIYFVCRLAALKPRRVKIYLLLWQGDETSLSNYRDNRDVRDYWDLSRFTEITEIYQELSR